MGVAPRGREISDPLALALLDLRLRHFGETLSERAVLRPHQPTRREHLVVALRIELVVVELHVTTSPVPWIPTCFSSVAMVPLARIRRPST